MGMTLPFGNISDVLLNMCFCWHDFISNVSRLFLCRYDGNTTIGYRLYREVTKYGPTKKSMGKECLAPPCFQWETLATNLEEFRNVVVSPNFYML